MFKTIILILGIIALLGFCQSTHGAASVRTTIERPDHLNKQTRTRTIANDSSEDDQNVEKTKDLPENSQAGNAIDEETDLPNENSDYDDIESRAKRRIIRRRTRGGRRGNRKSNRRTGGRKVRKNRRTRG